MADQTSVPLYLRTWRLQVLTPEDAGGNQTLIDIGSQQDSTAEMRVTFEVYTRVFIEMWQAEIVIYNPNLQLVQQISAGCQVSLAVGYQADGEPTEIFRGTLYQPLYEKRDGTDIMLTLLCFVGLKQLTNNIVHVVTGRFAQQRDIVLAMAAQAQSPVPIAYLAPQTDFLIGPLPRSRTIFGEPSTLFADVAEANNMHTWLDSSGLNMGVLKAAQGGTIDLTYAPPLQPGQTPPKDANVKYSLIGTPQQTEKGAAFRTLLDPKLRVKLPSLQVKLLNSLIRQQAIQPGQNQSILNQDGVYLIAAVTYLGDTRGNLWECQCEGITSVQGLMALQGGGH